MSAIPSPDQIEPARLDEACSYPPSPNEDKEAPAKLHRGLSSLHLQMIAFGGSIGTGLFVGSGKALASGGPLFLLIDLVLVGGILFTVIMALGELATTLPVSGSLASYSTRMLDPAWGFAMGWIYWLLWLMVLPFELVVATIVIRYWDVSERITSAVWIVIFLTLICGINSVGIKGYATVEVVGSMIKIAAILIFIFVAIIIDVGGGPNHQYLGAATWSEPGPTQNGFKGFCSVFVIAAFGYCGTELVGLAARECENPRKEIPKASTQVFWRTVFFYIVSLFLIGLIVPSDHPKLMGDNNASSSPFVIAFNIAGIKILPDIFNVVILVSVLSVGNSAIYGSSRTLVALAEDGHAPKFLAHIDSKGRPVYATGLSLAAGLLAFLQYASSQNLIFSWLLAVSGLGAIVTWGSVCAAHIRFRLAWARRGRSLEELPWISPCGVWGSVIGLLSIILVLILVFFVSAFPIKPDPTVSGRVSFFFQNYISVPIIFSLFLWAKLKWKTSIRSLDEIDLDTGREQVPLEILRAERDESKSRPLLQKLREFVC
ncbi:hypothetical protein OC846_005440 [Tilletia horrida]|uniref:Amino acid permease/ SLC12A domain-containing protein n=1 Tax=Tilletia horrida TaxID=155126 RepID=A0AAN6JQ84_9BASI|nr:hypothetical protein OC846_005440 [Tilletia horrida]KAK0561920.1 hypothetical protein OC861_005578 [Tilletia horrida]